jgi:hypothetical protein
MATATAYKKPEGKEHTAEYEKDDYEMMIGATGKMVSEKLEEIGMHPDYKVIKNEAEYILSDMKIIKEDAGGYALAKKGKEMIESGKLTVREIGGKLKVVSYPKEIEDRYSSYLSEKYEKKKIRAE